MYYINENTIALDFRYVIFSFILTPLESVKMLRSMIELVTFKGKARYVAKN
tara:strand:+ start:35694 stop:35846 length:153 start_codon:yes stop_codon:yes gene_type:complete